MVDLGRLARYLVISGAATLLPLAVISATASAVALFAALSSRGRQKTLLAILDRLIDLAAVLRGEPADRRAKGR